MWILGHIFRAFVRCFKMKQEVGKFMPVAPTLLPPVSQERREDGDKTVCQQFGFCQWEGSIAAALFNLRYLKSFAVLLKGNSFLQLRNLQRRYAVSMFLFKINFSEVQHNHYKMCLN